MMELALVGIFHRRIDDDPPTGEELQQDTRLARGLQHEHECQQTCRKSASWPLTAGTHNNNEAADTEQEDKSVPV